MPELLLILFKINLVLLLFAAAYYLVLRRLTFYTLNRVFLVGGILFSTIYPFIDLTDFFQRQQQLNPGVTALVPAIDVNTLINRQSVIDYWQVLVFLFYAGVVFMAFRLAVQFFSLYRIHQRSTPGAVNDLPVRILHGRVSPFSFWQTVYVNPDLHAENELETILAHERVHVKEWHTLDIILAEVSVVFYWFNPGVWLMKRAIKENIEFITDARIVKRGIDKKAYQYSLLGIGNLDAGVGLVNHFNLSDLKKRIKMMNAKRSSPKKLVLYVLILPVLLTTTLAFTINKKAVERHLAPLAAALPQVEEFITPAPEVVVVQPRKEVKRRAAAPELKPLEKRITLISKVITLQLDTVLGTLVPDATKLFLSKSVDVVAQMKGKVKGIQLSQVTSTDTLDFQYRPAGAKAIHIVLKKSALEAEGQIEPSISVSGFKSASAVDSLKAATRVVFTYEGKPLSAEELRQLTAEQIRKVNVQRPDASGSGMIHINPVK